MAKCRLAGAAEEIFRGFRGSQDVTGSAVMMSWERKRGESAELGA